MKTAFSTLGCPQWDLETIAAKTLEYGYDAIELRAFNRGPLWVTPKLDQNERMHVLKTLNGIEICCLSCDPQVGDPETVAKASADIIDCVKLAGDLHAPYIRIFPQIPEGVSYTAGAEAMIAALRGDVIKHARELSIRVLLETHGNVETGKKLRPVMDAFDDDDLIGVVWDIHHSLLENESIEDTYALVGKRIMHTHLKDAKKQGNGETLCLMGEGDYPMHEAIMLLQKNGYDGYYSLEWEKTWIPELTEPEVAFPQYIKYMRDRS